MVMKNSRHPITEAGLDAILDRLDESLKPHEAGSPAPRRLTYDGGRHAARDRPALPQDHPRSTAAGRDLDHLPRRRRPASPTLVQETAADGDLLERYIFRNLTTDPPALADAAAFDPDSRWGQPRGLLGRMAQGRARPDPAVRVTANLARPPGTRRVRSRIDADFADRSR